MEPISTGRRRYARRQACLLVGVLAVAAAVAANAEGADAHWSAEPTLSLAFADNAVWDADSSATYESLTGVLGVEISSARRSPRAGLFSAVRVTSGAEESDSLQAGGWASVDFSRWQARTAAMYLDPRNGAGHWFYAGNLRCRVSGDHWLGLEATGRAGGGRPDARLTYEGRIAGFLTLRLSVGVDAGGRPEAAARSEFVWPIR